ncbi:hypothetical protein HGRIS_006099 [Hohenbuehelia grisea]|uniref:Nas2 N-terminal domain-containing protein n=1 Tax=Hohenbuehelia grisea TaxID=104357 RepID=A0ABR3K0E7_9AGAR
MTMGLILPSPDSPREKARALMTRKANIEAEVEVHASVLKANNCTMQSPLVDAEGFPHANMDIYAVRGARVRIIELRNDLKAVTDDIAKALEEVYAVGSSKSTEAIEESETSGSSNQTFLPFARVDGVAPGSPAAESGMLREDLVTKFGHLTQTSFTSGSLKPVADLVAASENRVIQIKVLRGGQDVLLHLTPRQGWGGRGTLG